jgi:adenosylhomocysteinase
MTELAQVISVAEVAVTELDNDTDVRLTNTIEFRARPREAVMVFDAVLRRLEGTYEATTIRHAPRPGTAIGTSSVAELAVPRYGTAVLVLSPSDPDSRELGSYTLTLSLLDPAILDRVAATALLRSIETLPFTGFELERIRSQLPLTRMLPVWLPGKPLSELALFLTIHHMTDFIPMVETLIALGADPATVTIIDKEYPYALTRRVDAHLREALGLRVHRYSAIEGGLGDHFERAAAARRRTLVLDDGGYVLPVVVTAFPERVQSIVGVVEQTMSGIVKLAGMDVPVPVFSVAESRLKSLVEAYGIADASVRNILTLIPHEKLEGQSAVVVGYGRIGRQVAAVLRSRRMRVGVFDSDLLALVAAHEEGFETRPELGQLLEHQRPVLVVGTAGRGSVRGEHLQAFHRDCYLVSTTSRDYEFSLSEFAAAAVDVRRRGRLGTVYALPTGVHMTVLGHGMPINFHYAESLPNKYVDVVLAAMILSGTAIAASAGTLSPGVDVASVDRLLGSSALVHAYYERYGPPADGIVAAAAAPSSGERAAEPVFAQRDLDTAFEGATEEADGVLALSSAHGSHRRPRILLCHRHRFDAAPCEDTKLAATFAQHLDLVRMRRSLPRVTCVCCPGGVADGALPLPHLVAVGTGERIADAVIWEAFDPDCLSRWLAGAKADDVERLVGRLPQLLRLRRYLRENRPGDGGVCAELRALLAHRYLSTRFALEHLDVVDRAVRQLALQGTAHDR